MILRYAAFVCSALLACASVAFGQTPGLSGGQPWLADRSVGEGAGIRTGAFELHPGVSGEFGLDTNFFQRSSSGIEQAEFGPPASALRLRILPYISLRTLDRRLDAKGLETKRTLAFEAGAQLSYNGLLGLDGAGPEYSQVQNFQGGGGARLTLFPNGKWSSTADASYAYRYDPTNQGGLTSDFGRHIFDLSALIRWRPGGGAFDWNVLSYATTLSIFDQTSLSIYNNQQQTFMSDGRWRFLPKTAVVFDGTLGLIRYGAFSRLNDGDYLQGRMGLSGLIGTRFGVLAILGWATSFYANQNGMARNYDGPVGNLEGKYYLTTGAEKLAKSYGNVGASTLALGYSRSFIDGYLSDFYRRDRLYGKFGYLIGGVLVTRMEAGLSFVTYPDFLVEGNPNSGFGEQRLDLMGFAEYRLKSTIGLNLTLRYDQNFSQVVSGVTYQDDLSFQRFVALIGARWFL